MRTKTASIVQDVMSSDFHQGMSTSIYRRYRLLEESHWNSCVYKTMWRNSKKCPCSHCLRVTVLHNVMVVNRDEEVAVVLNVASSAFVGQSIASSTPGLYISLFFRSVIRSGLEGVRLPRELDHDDLEPVFWEGNPSHYILEALHLHHAFQQVVSIRTCPLGKTWIAWATGKVEEYLSGVADLQPFLYSKCAGINWHQDLEDSSEFYNPCCL